MPHLLEPVCNTGVDHALNSPFVQHLMAGLRGHWLLGRERQAPPGSTDLDRWRNAITAAFSEEYLLLLEDKQSIALQHTLDLALFDSVKVSLLASGTKAAIQELCVSLSCSLNMVYPSGANTARFLLISVLL